ncbi:MAG: chromate transporter, partial [Clostridia bacterium]|nr:chromate transporter [Clostridia bacterium]
MQAFKKYLQLFWAFFKIGLFTFGGGYAMISVISNEIVEKRKYITAVEFADIVAIAESTPGPIAINSATFIGYRRGGVLGAILSSIAVTLPSFIKIFIICLFFDEFLKFELVQKAFSGVQCAVAVLIISAEVKL